MGEQKTSNAQRPTLNVELSIEAFLANPFIYVHKIMEQTGLSQAEILARLRELGNKERAVPA